MMKTVGGMEQANRSLVMLAHFTLRLSHMRQPVKVSAKNAK